MWAIIPRVVRQSQINCRKLNRFRRSNNWSSYSDRLPVHSAHIPEILHRQSIDDTFHNLVTHFSTSVVTTTNSLSQKMTTSTVTSSYAGSSDSDLKDKMMMEAKATSDRLPEHSVHIPQRLHHLPIDEKNEKLAEIFATEFIIAARKKFTTSTSTTYANLSKFDVKDMMKKGFVDALDTTANGTIPVSPIFNTLFKIHVNRRNERIEKERKTKAIMLKPVSDQFHKDMKPWVECAVNIFNAFDEVFMNTSVDNCPEIAMKQLASEGLSRVISYMIENGTATVYSLEMCFLLGKSEKEVEVDFNFNGTVRKVHLSTIIEKAGVKTVGSSPIYYVKSSIGRYFYRKLFCSQPHFFRKLFCSESIDENVYTKLESAPENVKYSSIMNPTKYDSIVATVLRDTNSTDDTKPQLARLKKGGKSIVEMISDKNV